MSALLNRFGDSAPISTRFLDGRTTLATIVQSSTVELFQVFEIAVAPIPQLKKLPSDLDRLLSAAASFSGTALNGMLAVFFPAEICSQVKQPTAKSFEPRDWTRELCNQLAGRIKNRLHSCSIELKTGLPTGVPNALMERHRTGKPPEVMFGFRALRGEVTITITGTIDFGQIVYTGNRSGAQEGDVILF